jgi:hypothetical protein
MISHLLCALVNCPYRLIADYRSDLYAHSDQAPKTGSLARTSGFDPLRTSVTGSCAESIIRTDLNRVLRSGEIRN